MPPAAGMRPPPPQSSRGPRPPCATACACACVRLRAGRGVRAGRASKAAACHAGRQGARTPGRVQAARPRHGARCAPMGSRTRAAPFGRGGSRMLQLQLCGTRPHVSPHSWRPPAPPIRPARLRASCSRPAQHSQLATPRCASHSHCSLPPPPPLRRKTATKLGEF